MADAKTVTKIKKGAKFVGMVAGSIIALKIGASYAASKGWLPATVTKYFA